MSFSNTGSLWDLSLPAALPSLADDDFIALLQKQFGVPTDSPIQASPLKDNNNSIDSIGNIDPASLTRFPVASETTPSSEESSPSPPSYNDSTRSRRESGVFGNDRSSGTGLDDDSAPKRKASEDDLDDEPNHKSQHTTNVKKGNSSRRKSTGNNADETRVLKRKEQNRAAQRAFRERKEKHVKDLEDKVAALEEKNQVATTENESLREVISRLQSENMRLRQSSFTFAVPPTTKGQPQGEVANSLPTDSARETPLNLFNSPSSSSGSVSTHDSPQSLFINDKNDQTAMFFGQPMTVMETEPQQTATSDAMGMDFGFGPVHSETPYTTIASNPMFMSFREPDPVPFDGTGSNNFASQGTNQTTGANSFDFLQGFSWPDVAMQDTSQLQSFDLSNSLDELFGGSYIGNSGPIDYANFKAHGGGSTSSLSPISHQTSKSSSSTSSTDSSSVSSPSSQTSLTGSPSIATNGKAAPNGTNSVDSWPTSKKNVAKCVFSSEESMFTTPSPSADPPNSSIFSSCAMPDKKMSSFKAAHAEFVPCRGLQLPKTEKSEANVEVMAAWRKIRSDPQYQDVDINELCSEFASKAKCDGSQVVIEPEGMKEIIETHGTKITPRA